MSYRITLVLLFVSLAFVLIGCSEDSSQTQNVTIALSEIVSEPKQVELERHPQNNCGGTSETDYEVRRSRVIVRELEVGAGFEANAKGEVSVLGTGVALGAAVSGQVGSTYGTQDSLERAVIVRAAPGTKMEHEISHQEIWKVGTATVVVNGQRVEVPFRYRHEFTLVLLDSRQLPCDHTPTPAATYTAIPSTVNDHGATATMQALTPTPFVLTNTPTNTPMTPLALPPVFGVCVGSISRPEVDAWAKVGSTDKVTTQSYITNYFGSKMEMDSGFVQGDTVPAGVLIATDFGNGESEVYLSYPVKPVAHYRSWGLFETTNSFVASFPGACLVIR